MAKSADGSNVAQDLQKPTIYSLRCRLCRTHLLSSDKVTSSHKINPELCGKCLYLDEEDLPSWIQNEVELSGWTKGRLHCPKQDCTARVGGFDFVQGLLCACGVFTIPAIWIQDGKVDNNIISDRGTVTPDQTERSPNQNSTPISQNTREFSTYFVRTPERKCDLSLVGKVEYETERNNLLSSEGNVPHDHSGSTDNVGIAATVVSVTRAREDRNKKSSEECRDDLNFVKTGRHPKCNRATFVSHRRDPELVHSRNRFGNLKVEQPKLVSLQKPVSLASVKEVADNLVCAICLECFYKPYECPCSHIFCEPCLRQLYHARSGTLKCPVCRRLIDYVEPANELREELLKFHLITTKVRETFENSAKHRNWPLPPTGPLAVVKRWQPLVPWRDKIFIKSSGILLVIVCCVILYILKIILEVIV